MKKIEIDQEMAATIMYSLAAADHESLLAWDVEGPESRIVRKINRLYPQIMEQYQYMLQQPHVKV